MRWIHVALLLLLILVPSAGQAQAPMLRCVDQSAGNFASVIRSDMTLVREADGLLLGPVIPVANGSARYQLPSANMRFMYLVAWNNSLVVYDLGTGTSQAVGQCADLAPTPAPQAPGVDSSQVMGQCRDHVRGYDVTLLRDFTGFRSDAPAAIGPIQRDATGQYFLRLPSQTPTQNAFFAGWDGALYELSMTMPVGQQIGWCNFAPDVVASPPQAPALPVFTYGDNRMVVSGDTRIPLPDGMYGQTVGVAPPMIATEQQANACLVQYGQDAAAFVDCLAPSMMTPNQRKAYDCIRGERDEMATATCLAGTLVGRNEQRALRDVEACYRQVGTEWEKYALCMGEKQADERTVKAFQCVRAQAESADPSAIGVATCLAAGSLNLNPELTIAVECAATSGGEPLTFAGCAGGRLTARELEKCLNHGIGEGGCFGPNNEIVKGLRQLGVDMQQVLNPNGFAIQAFNTAVNDISNGPGPNNDVVRAIETINNDIVNGPGPNNDVVKVLEGVLGGIF
ncbi:MAG: hypothetical protein NT046_06310 [Arenimonas sp.]|nr:hypothetical protein [Arenimonas sp.]